MSDLSLRAPDPEATGKIHNIVQSAHKWGGDGHRPLFRKIREVLLRKHPEVIAKAFGGNANVAAAWIKNNWYRLRGQEPPPTRGRRAVSATMDFREVPRDFFDGGDELFLATDGKKDGSLVYVTALRTGEWKVNPVAGRKDPLRIDKGFMEDVLQAWQENAWEYVTVPTYHTDQDPLANTGFVKDLTMKPDPKRPGEHVLRAGIEFTDPEAEQKVLQGSVAGVSVNVKSNVKHQETGKTFKKVLTHLCLTNIPFINGLDAFGSRLAAGRTDDDPVLDVVCSYELEDDLALRTFTEDRRKSLASSGKALPDGSFPIETVGDLRNAITAFGRAKNKSAAKAHIVKRAKALGRTDLLPSDWSFTLPEDDFMEALFALAKDVYNEEQDFTYVRQQIQAQLSKGYYLDKDGDVVDPSGNDTAGEHETGPLSPAYVYVMGMTPDQVLVCACSTSDVEDGSAPNTDMGAANGYMHGWVLGYEVDSTGEVTLDPIDEWVAVEKKWVPADTGVTASVPISGEIEVNDVVFTLVKRDEPESSRGGDDMPEDAKPDTKETPNPTDTVTLTREQAEELAQAKVDEALTAYRAEQEEQSRQQEEQLSAMRKELHVRTVKEKVAELVKGGHAPAVIAKAEEIMLADERHDAAVSLTREDNEVALSATDIVTELLAAIPATALTATVVDKPDPSKIAEDSKSRADELYEELFGKDAAPAASLS